MDRFPPVPSLIPPSIVPWYVLAEAPRWIFQNIDLPSDPEAFPWSLFCRVIRVDQKYAFDQSKGVRSTRAFGINSNGVVVGYYVEEKIDKNGVVSDGPDRGFRRNADGSIDCFAVILANGQFADNTDPYAINDQGYIVGGYDAGNVHGGFQCKPFPPGGANALTSQDFMTWGNDVTSRMLPNKPKVGVTVFTGITNSFEITGFYETDTRHGLVLRGGSATQLGQPTFVHDDKFFEPFGITQTGDIVGTIDPENLQVPLPLGGEGFLLPAKEIDAGQTYVPVYFREALFLTARGATSTGHVVGFYSSTQEWSPTKGDFHGFMAFHGYPNYVPFPDYQIYQLFFQPIPHADDVRIQDVNERREIVGFFQVGNDVKGFMISPFLRFRSFPESIVDHIISGVLSDSGGQHWTPGGPGPINPWGPERVLSSPAREAIQAILISEQCRGLSSSDGKEARKAAVAAALKALQELGRHPHP